MRRTKKFEINNNSEFELDLAPLLAVMVKLVPVLIVSSAFVQTSIIETELPQVVQQAIHEQENKPIPTTVSLHVDNKIGFEIQVVTKSTSENFKVPNVGSKLDYTSLHLKLIEIKTKNPEIFKLELRPTDSVAYDDLVKVMDEARASKDSNTKFPITDKKTGQKQETIYMFPEIVFANMLEG